MTPHISTEPNEPPALEALREKVTQNTPPEPAKIIIGKKARSGSMFGMNEIIALASSGAILLLILGFYFFWVMPAKSKNKELAARRDKLETELTAAHKRVDKDKTTQATVDDLVSSVERFETNYLPPKVQGSTRIYERLNDLIRANGLRNVAGPDYLPLDPNTKSQTEADDSKAGRAKFQSLFPGLYVTTTVEGSYGNLRRLIQQLEQSGQFVVINAVELEPADSVEKQTVKTPNAKSPVAANPNNVPGFNQPSPNFAADPNANPLAPGGINSVNNPKTLPNQMPVQPMNLPRNESETERVVKRRKGEIVSLKLEMATYFRREDISNAPTTTVPANGK